MANIRKKVINTWDGGILTNSRDNNPDTSFGSQMIKNFDVYRDPKRLVPMQDWSDFTLASEQNYNIRAMGGIDDTVYGLGSALSNWYGSGWDYRLKITLNNQLHTSNTLPIRLDMSQLPQDFWDNVQEDMSDLRLTGQDKVTPYALHTENVDYDAQTGDLWIQPNVFDDVSYVSQTVYQKEGNTTDGVIDGSSFFAYAVPVSMNGSTWNRINVRIGRTDQLPDNDITIALYSDSGGTPNALVATLGTIPKHVVSTIEGTITTLYTDDYSLSGTYWLVYTTTGFNNGAYSVRWGNTGTDTIKYASNAGLSSWVDQDSSATPYYYFYYDNLTQLPERSCYLYYGNSDATAIPYGTKSVEEFTNSGLDVFNINQIRWMYTFGDEKTGNLAYANNTTGDTEAFTTTPLFEDGLFGKAIISSGLSTDPSDNVFLSSGGAISLSFLVYLSAWGNITFYTDINSGWSVGLDTNGKVKFSADGSEATTTSTTTNSVPLFQWVLITCVFNDDHFIYINKALETFNVDDGSYDPNNTANTLNVSIGSQSYLSHPIGMKTALTQADVNTLHNDYFYQDQFFTIGSQELQTSSGIQYDGVQLYQKSISSGNWTESLNNGRPIKNLEYYPVNGFIDDSSTYFVLSQDVDNGGLLYLASVDNDTIIDPTHLLLSTIGNNSNKIVVQPDTPLDRVTYFNYGNSDIASVGDPGEDEEFTVGGTVQSLVPWRDYLAIGYSRRNRAFFDIWDLASTNATERIDCGNGNMRIVGNASDILFTVVDNFTDNAVKSSNKPTIEVRQYVGNGQSEKTHEIEVPVVVTSYSDNWERMVSNFKIRRNTQTLFYMRIPTDATATSFNEGFWAIGKNSRGQLSLTLQIDTANLGMPENVFGFAQQVFFIQKDGAIKRLSDSNYTKTSLYKTLKMNEGNTEIEKKLHGIEIITEPLEEDQVISVYYKRDGETSRTLICTMTGENEISKEAVTIESDGTNLNNYKEVEFEIESTGGKSAILEFNYRYEYLSDIV